MLYGYIIDVSTSLPKGNSPVGRHHALIRTLSKLKTTTLCADGGRYRHELSSAQIHLITTWTLEQLEKWCYTNKAATDFIGAVERSSLIQEYLDKLH